MGIEHEKIHLETSAVIMAQLPLSFINLEYAQREFPYSDSSYRQHWSESEAPEIISPDNKLVNVP